MSWRRLRVLVRYLPADSATRRALDDESAGWGLSEQLLAAIADAVQGGNWQRSGGRGLRPKPIPRPGVTERRRTYGRPSRPGHEVGAYLARFAPPPPEHAGAN